MTTTTLTFATSDVLLDALVHAAHSEIGFAASRDAELRAAFARALDPTAVPEPTFISGDWLLSDGAKGGYAIGYEAIVTGHWSGGVSAIVTRRVLDAIMAAQVAVNAHIPESDVFTVQGDVVFIRYPGADFDAQRLGPRDIGGHYDVPGWAWEVVKADECRITITNGES